MVNPNRGTDRITFVPSDNSRLPSMQGWVVAAVWAGTVVFAAIVLGFAVYEVSWKSRRLAADRRKIMLLAQQFADLAGRTRHSDEV